MVTIADIAKMAGVSTSMVSRAINNKGNVKEENRIKIMKIVEETGYTMNLQAQALRTKHSGIVVFLIPSFDSRLVSEMVTDLSHVLEDSNYSLVINNYHHSMHKESLLAKIQKFSSRGVEAIIVFSNIQTKEFIEGLKKIQTPLIIINGSYDFLPCLWTDHYRAGYMLASYAIQKGYTKIGMPTPLDGMFNKGIIQALHENHIELNHDYVIEQVFDIPHRTASEQMAKKLYDLEDKPEVFITVIDRLSAITKIDYEAMGGKDIVFMGAGNTEYSTIAKSTSVDYHKRKTSMKILEILTSITEGKEIEPIQYTSECELIIRED